MIASGNGRAHHDVILAGETVQQQLKYGQHHSKKRRMPALGQGHHL